MPLAMIMISIFGAVWFTLIGIYHGKREISAQERISRALGKAEIKVYEDKRSLKERMLHPLLHKFAAGLKRWVPNSHQGQISMKLSEAGLSGVWEELEWKGMQYALGIVLGFLLWGMFSLMHSSLIIRLAMGIVGFLIGYLFPNTWLTGKARQRQQEIEKTLPDVLDLLTVSVEAGLGFDSALLKVVEKQKGILAEEFLRVLQEIKMGRPRRETLKDMAKRNKSSENLGNVVASLVQADQLGISVGGVLRNQAKQIRQKQRQTAEEKAQKAPVKMMIPLVFFVFPSIFIIILGPAVIQIIVMFK